MKTILLIDDDPDHVEITIFILTRSNYNVLVAQSAEEGLALLQNNTPDLILLDILLPNLQGDEFCKQLKAEPQFKNIPIILWTASTSDIDLRIKDTNADDFLRKPFDADELLKKIKKFID